MTGTAWSNRQCNTFSWSAMPKSPAAADLAARSGNSISSSMLFFQAPFCQQFFPWVQEENASMRQRYKVRQSLLVLSGWLTQVTLSWEWANSWLLRGSVSPSCPDIHTEQAPLRGVQASGTVLWNTPPHFLSNMRLSSVDGIRERLNAKTNSPLRGLSS